MPRHNATPVPDDGPRRLVPFRLAEADRAAITRIRDHFALPSDAAAVRYALHRFAESLNVPHQPRNQRRPR